MAILLKAARINAEKTQEEAGEYVGKTKQTIANYESYTSIPDIETAMKLAEFYGLTVDDIVWSRYIFLRTDCALSTTRRAEWKQAQPTQARPYSTETSQSQSYALSCPMVNEKKERNRLLTVLAVACGII